MRLIFMKGIYLLIRTEELSSLHTKASQATVQSKLCIKHRVRFPRGADVDYELANNLNNEVLFNSQRQHPPPVSSMASN